MEWFLERVSVATYQRNVPLYFFYGTTLLSFVGFLVNFLFAWAKCGHFSLDCVDEATLKITFLGNEMNGLFAILSRSFVVYFRAAVGVVAYITLMSLGVGMCYYSGFWFVVKCIRKQPVVVNPPVDVEENK